MQGRSSLSVSRPKPFDPNNPKSVLDDLIKQINKKNSRAERLVLDGDPKGSLQELRTAESFVHSLKKFWYLHQKDFGDLLKCPPAYKAITLTLNNLGLHFKQAHQVQ